MKTIDGKDYYTVRELAEKVGRTTQAVNVWARNGTLKTVQVGRLRMIEAEEFHAQTKIK